MVSCNIEQVSWAYIIIKYDKLYFFKELFFRQKSFFIYNAIFKKESKLTSDYFIMHFTICILI